MKQFGYLLDRKVPRDDEPPDEGTKVLGGSLERM
jgi:hypothetical protein